MVHREDFISKSLLTELQLVLNQAIKVFNIIKFWPFQSWLFSPSTVRWWIQSIHLYHTDIHWLSWGKFRNISVISRLKWFRSSRMKKRDFGFCLHCKIWWLKVHFLSDLFDKINSLNLSLVVVSKASMVKVKSSWLLSYCKWISF